MEEDGDGRGLLEERSRLPSARNEQLERVLNQSLEEVLVNPTSVLIEGARWGTLPGPEPEAGQIHQSGIEPEEELLPKHQDINCTGWRRVSGGGEG